WTEAAIPGQPILTFAPKDFVTLHGLRERATIDSVKFTDVTSDAGFPSTPAAGGASASALALGDVDGNGRDELFVSTRSAVHLYRVHAGFVQDARDRSGIALSQGAAFATFADYDNDGWLDLFTLGGDGRAHLFRNGGTG